MEQRVNSDTGHSQNTDEGNSRAKHTPLVLPGHSGNDGAAAC